jgi:hypothetical protein
MTISSTSALLINRYSYYFVYTCSHTVHARKFFFHMDIYLLPNQLSVKRLKASWYDSDPKIIITFSASEHPEIVITIAFLVFISQIS